MIRVFQGLDCLCFDSIHFKLSFQKYLIRWFEWKHWMCRFKIL